MYSQHQNTYEIHCECVENSFSATRFNQTNQLTKLTKDLSNNE